MKQIKDILCKKIEVFGESGSVGIDCAEYPNKKKKYKIVRLIKSSAMEFR